MQDLALRYEQALSEEQIEQLIELVDGHPYLLQVALYHITHNHYTLAKILKIASHEDGPYSEHLRRHRVNLETHPELIKAVKMIMNTEHPLPVAQVNGVFRLRSMGLVKVNGDMVMPLCDLYRRYFNKRL